MESLFKCLTLIQHVMPTIFIHVHKVRAHTNILGNNIIDQKVRNATNLVRYTPSSLNSISYPVILTQIQQHCMHKWKSSWKSKSNPKRIISQSHSKFCKKIYHLITMGNFNIHQTGIMVRLITDHMELNEYLFNKQIKCPKSDTIPDTPKCDQCNANESIYHYIMKCTKYNQQRSKFRYNLCKISNIYRSNEFFQLKYLLFPYHTPNITIIQQIAIWKEILSYTKNTNRFQNISRMDTTKL